MQLLTKEQIFAADDIITKEVEVSEWEETLTGVFLFLTWIGFLVGVVTLAVFAIKNLG